MISRCMLTSSRSDWILCWMFLISVLILFISLSYPILNWSQSCLSWAMFWRRDKMRLSTTTRTAPRVAPSWSSSGSPTLRIFRPSKSKWPFVVFLNPSSGGPLDPVCSDAFKCRPNTSTLIFWDLEVHKIRIVSNAPRRAIDSTETGK